VKRRVVLVVEDALSEAMMRKVIAEAGNHLTVDRQIVTDGSGNMQRDVPKYRAASRAVPHVVLADLDRVACPADLRRRWQATSIPDTMLFNVAVREVEAWLLADQEGIAALLGIATHRVPRDADAESDPKRALVNLARQCRSKRLREELVPAIGSVNQVGPFYNVRLSHFVIESWCVQRARTRSRSLARAVERIRAFVAK